MIVATTKPVFNNTSTYTPPTRQTPTPKPNNYTTAYSTQASSYTTGYTPASSVQVTNTTKGKLLIFKCWWSSLNIKILSKWESGVKGPNNNKFYDLIINGKGIIWIKWIINRFSKFSFCYELKQTFFGSFRKSGHFDSPDRVRSQFTINPDYRHSTVL